MHELGDELHFGRPGGDGAVGHQGDPLVGDIGRCGDGGDFVGAHLHVRRIHEAETEVEGAATGQQVDAEDLGCATGVDGLTAGQTDCPTHRPFLVNDPGLGGSLPDPTHIIILPVKFGRFGPGISLEGHVGILQTGRCVVDQGAGGHEVLVHAISGKLRPTSRSGARAEIRGVGFETSVGHFERLGHQTQADGVQLHAFVRPKVKLEVGHHNDESIGDSVRIETLADRRREGGLHGRVISSLGQENGHKIVDAVGLEVAADAGVGTHGGHIDPHPEGNPAGGCSGGVQRFEINQHLVIGCFWEFPKGPQRSREGAAGQVKAARRSESFHGGEEPRVGSRALLRVHGKPERATIDSDRSVGVEGRANFIIVGLPPERRGGAAVEIVERR